MGASGDLVIRVPTMAPLVVGDAHHRGAQNTR
jgi:hypothetical protein